MSMDAIDHVVVLMLENRSFDSMLGWLYDDEVQVTQNIPAAAPGDRFRGLKFINPDDWTNTAMNGVLVAKPTRGADGFTVLNVDPGEEFAHVNTQFFETPSPAPGAPLTMKGVLADFVDI